MTSQHSSMSAVDDSNSVPTSSGAKLDDNPCPPDDELSKSIRVALQLEARQLPNLDTRGKSDPFVILYRKSDKSTSTAEKWDKIGQTETVYNNLNPKWSTTFNVEYRIGTTTALRFSIYDRDSKDEDLSKHDYIGEVRCTVAQVVLADYQRLQLQINNKNVKPGTQTGTLIVRAEEQQGDLGDNVTFQFAVTGLRRGRKSFYVLSNKNRNDEEFSPIIYSEVHKVHPGANHVTTFKPITTPLARLTNGDMNRELEVQFMDYNRLGSHSRVGSVRFTFKYAKAAIASSSPAKFTLKKKKSNGHVVETGQLILNKCGISAPFSFIDYIHGGVEIKTIIAIDMSATNGNPADPHSLHYQRGENEYMIALREVGGVLSAYDTSRRFPTFGLGAAQPPLFNETVHCFPLSGPNGQLVCNGVNEVIEAYSKALHMVAPSGPCRYGPLLNHVIDVTRTNNTKHGAISYTVLLLFTDGDFVDFADVANLICDGAELPMSIVFVGIGNSRFLDLERLDGDNERLCSTEGIQCARDIVQFVQFHKYRYNPTQLAREVLDKIPEQVVSYMRSKGLKPSDITPLRKVTAPVTEKPPYLPEGVVHSIPSTKSDVHTPPYAPVVSASLPGISVPPTSFHPPSRPLQQATPSLQSVHSSGAEAPPSTSNFNGQVQNPHDPLNPGVPLQGAPLAHGPHIQHPKHSQPSVHVPPNYNTSQYPPAQYPGGYVGNLQIHYEPPQFHHQHPRPPQQHPSQHPQQHQPPQYHHPQPSHSQQQTQPHHYRPHSYPYVHPEAQYGGVYNQGTQPDTTTTSSSYSISVGQPYHYPPTLTPTPPQGLPYHNQHSQPNYQSQ